MIRLRNVRRNCLVVGLTLTLGLFQNCSGVRFDGNSPLAAIQSSNSTSASLSAGSVDQTLPTPAPTNTDPVSAPPSSKLVAKASPSTQLRGLNTTLAVSAQNLTSVSYTCVALNQSASLLKGTIDLNSPQAILPVLADMQCDVVGHNDQDPNFQELHAQVGVGMDCGNQFKVNGACVDFSCKTVVELTSAQLMNIPARTADGICYSYKVISALSSGASSLTGSKDGDVISAYHGGSGNWNPYLMGHFNGEFSIAGPRVVKLAGGKDAISPILVDNFILFGIYPSNAVPTDFTKAYQAQGTSDSGVRDASGVSAKTVTFRGQAIPLEAFGTGGTSSVAPIHLSTVAPVGIVNTLDIRAEDCGGSRALSDIYLLFQ